jgi:subtilisin family serine protease
MVVPRCIFLSILIFGFSSSLVARASESHRYVEYAPGELIVRFKEPSPGLGRMEAMSTLSAMGLQILRPIAPSLGGMAVYRVREGDDVQMLSSRLRFVSGIEYVSPNYLFQLRPGAAVPMNPVVASVAKPPLLPRPSEVMPPVSDPDIGFSYGLQRMQAYEAWSTAQGDSSMVVAVIDTGVDYNHEDLAFNMWRNPFPSELGDIVGFDPYARDGLPYDDDAVYGHGTHAAGIIGAVYGNGKGLAGVNQRVSIMAIKGLNGNGFAWTEHLISGMVYAIDHGAKIISASWANAKKENQPIIDVLNYAAEKGVLVVVAAGNSAGDNDNDATAEYPAGYVMENLLAVASVDENDNLARSSNYGARTVALAAPGVNIYSTLPGHHYGFESGTSMACPAAAGVAALVWSKYPKLTNVQVKRVLMESVDHLPSLAGKTITGGRINAARALAIAKAMTNP